MSTVVVAAVGAAVAITVPALADTNLPPGSAGGIGVSTTGIDPDVATAMERDLALSPAQVGTRLRKERWAGKTEATLRTQLATTFAGAWISPQGDQLVVNVTTTAAAAKVKAAGAQPKIVARTESELDSIKSGLDQHAKHATGSVAGWYVDVTTASVVVVAKPGGEAAARALVAASGAPTEAVQVVTTKEAPRLLYDVRGADAYFIDNKARCSIGFSVVGGFVSAGHCGTAGSKTAGFNQVTQGTFQASTFPGHDYSYVTVNSNWTPTGVVNDYNGGTVAVSGSTEAAVGAAVCRSGSTTGTHCGVIQAKNAMVNYAEGTVTGLTRTNVCAEPGDSGGSWLSGNQAQGVTSGGSGDCTNGGTTFFQPINPILAAYNLTLVTSGGGTTPPTSPSPSASASVRPSASSSSARPSTPASSSTSARPSAPGSSSAQPSAPGSSAPGSSPAQPSAHGSSAPGGSATPSLSPTSSASPSTPPSTPPGAVDCSSLEASADGTLASTGARQTVPSAGYFRARTGQHIACLSVPGTADFNLTLQRWSGHRWQTVAVAASAGAGQDEQLSYTGNGGYYRYRVSSADGSGQFLLTADIP